MTTFATVPTPAVAPPTRLTFARLLCSELIKLVTLRSTWWSLGIAVALSVGISAVVAAASASFPPGFPPASAILLPTQFTMLVVGILGAIVVTGEYSTGMIRSTLTAEPRRGAVLVAKATAVSALVAVTSAIGYGVAVAVTAPLLSTPIDWAVPEQSIVPLAWGVVAMVAVTLIGVGFGFVLRHGAGAIAATVGVLFVLPVALSVFGIAGESWRRVAEAVQYLPSDAASRLASPGSDDIVSPLLTLVVWVVVLNLAGWAALRTRDA